MRAALTQQFQVLVADDAAVKDPAPAGFPKLLFDRVQDVLQRRAIQTVAGKDFIGGREALGRDDPGQDELLAVGPVIARVAALGLGHGVGVALEIVLVRS